jgi:hypothetical protein
MKGRGNQSILSTPTVRRHSLSTDLGVIMTALDGGALTLPHQRGREYIGEISNIFDWGLVFEVYFLGGWFDGFVDFILTILAFRKEFQ